MPTLFRKFPFACFFAYLLVCCFTRPLYSPVLASTDPIAATTSATATVPTTTPTTSDTITPSAPILVRPVDNSVTGDNRPEFVFRRSSDPDSNTLTYTLYLGGVASYLGISDAGNSSGKDYTARLEDNEIKLLPTTPLPDGLYSWYVTASDLSGNTSQSTTWSFLIDTASPPLVLLELDDLDSPAITEGANFDIAGPKDIYFTVLSDPFVDIQITLISHLSITSHLDAKTNSQGLAYLYQHLQPGQYSVTIVAIDQGRNTTALPGFTLTITQAQITVPLPPLPGLPPSYSLPYTPFSIPSLPATISKIESRLPLAYIIVGLLAVAIYILLIFVWKRRYNLLLVDRAGNPIGEATIYHSLPTTRSSLTPILVTKLEPISYTLTQSMRGRLYIRHLKRYSTLTIRVADTTYILSLSVTRGLYHLSLE